MNWLIDFQYNNFFQTYLGIELLSPIITPYILLFKLRSEALALVDFFRNFTVEVVGVGDVCSFAQMDVRKHGNPTWQASTYDDDDDMDLSDLAPKNSFVQVGFIIFILLHE
jgi:autophagy-related protein 9